MSEEAPVTSVTEPSTPATPAPEAAPAPVSEQPAQTAPTAQANSASYFTNDQLAEMQRFISNNGGYDKAWARMKDSISRPQAVTQPEAPQAPSMQQMAQQPYQQLQAPQNVSRNPRGGGMSLEEIAVVNQFERFANEPQYASIADEIKTGEVLKGLRRFNIDIFRRDNGNFNDEGIRDYLDLYAKTKPAKPTSTEPTNSMAMADDLSNIKEITSMDDANRIELDNIRRRAAGQPENPLAAKARDYVRAHYADIAKNGR